MPFITFVRTGECPELFRCIYGSREIPPDVAAMLEGRSAEPGFLGQFIENIRNEGSVARGPDNEAYNAALQIVHRAACDKVILAVRQFGFETAIMESPVLGAEGNKEFLLHAHH